MKESETYSGLKISRLRSLALLLFVASCTCLFSNGNHSSVKGKKQEPYALLMGTCFDERGFSLPGVTLVVQMEPPAGQKVKQQRWRMLSSPRGEFALRLPAGRHSF